jgi:hypothetical protein
MHLPGRAEDNGKGLTGECFPPVNFCITAMQDEAETGLLV